MTQKNDPNVAFFGSKMFTTEGFQIAKPSQCLLVEGPATVGTSHDMCQDMSTLVVSPKFAISIAVICTGPHL